MSIRSLCHKIRVNLNKFLLLMWKNLILLWRHPIQTMVEILIPLMFCVQLSAVNYLGSQEEISEVIYPPYDPMEVIQTRPDALKNITAMAYSPKSNLVDALMQHAADMMGLDLIAFTDGQSMERFFENETNMATVIGGVQFADSLVYDTVLPMNLNIAFRFPAELRSYTSEITTWVTNLIFPMYQSNGPRDPESIETAAPGYYEEGFLALQMAVSQAILNRLNITPPLILLRRYPYPSWASNYLQRMCQLTIGLTITMSFFYPCMNIVKAITTEKEKQLKEILKLMGLPNWMHWAAWFLKAFITLSITALIMVILLTVRWFPGSKTSVFDVSNPFVLFIFMLVYISAAITFCFALSTFFTRASMATAIAGLMWFVSFIIFLFLRQDYDTLSRLEKICSSLSVNTAMSFAMHIAFMHEGNGEGVQWSNIWKTANSRDNVTFGLMIIMLLIDTLIYLLIALYVEAVFPGNYGIPKVWYFPFLPSYWCGSSKYADHYNLNEESGTNNDIFEKEPSHLHAGVQIRQLRKLFSNRTIVDTINLNLYENQITALLGHNGAGKTTTMLMLTGFIPPTTGTAHINGYNILTDIARVRKSLGFCPQHNILFDDLTVREHIEFFCTLKGMSKDLINSEVQKFVDMLELQAKINTKSCDLSGGMKRKLCVAMALCGGSKVVILDEPSSGMDPSARRTLWNLLKKEKHGRTILLSTHFMDEADLLGDRMAILLEGRLQCCGSGFFLKNKYGSGYRLIIDRSTNCDTDQVTSLLQKYLPNLQVASCIGSELTYQLSKENVTIFEEMLLDLEHNSEQLGIYGYGISIAGLEEVFMRVDNVNNRNVPSTSNLKISVPKVTGWLIIWNQISAMFQKRSLMAMRNWMGLLSHVLIAIAFLFFSTSADPTSTRDNLPSLHITAKSYTNPIAIINGKSQYKHFYIETLEASGVNCHDIDENDLVSYIMQKTTDDKALVRQNFILGATFGNETITVWFNNQPYHTPPLALATAVNSILKAHLNFSYTIDISNYPLPRTISSMFHTLSAGINSPGLQLALNTGYGMALVSAYFILYYVKEKATSSKHLQFVSGVNTIIFWLVSFIWDLLVFSSLSLCVTLALWAMQRDGFKTVAALGNFLCVFIFFGFCVLPLDFLAAFLFKSSAGAYVKVAFFNLLTGAFLQITLTSSDAVGGNTDIIQNMLLAFPHFSLTASINNIYTTSVVHEYCNSFVVKCSESEADNMACWNQACDTYKQCCNTDLNYFKWETPGITRNIVIFAVTGIVCFSILLFIDGGIIKKKTRSVPPPQDFVDEDGDVAKEKQLIRSKPFAELTDYSVVLKDVTKCYKKFFAVKGICLGAKRNECFGLLGVNGAGKTTTFKMMTGDLSISYGDVLVNGISIRKHKKFVHKLVGYCPQFDALLEDLTGRETLKIYCLLRGIPSSKTGIVAEELAYELDFHNHLDKKVKEMSGGNKRKLSTAIALIGDPPLIYLDEPTTGMDPATKRHLWNCLSKIRDSGKCIILTSHSMEECEALCTRLAIMVNGTFRCLGSTQHLKNKFAKGYILTVKVKRPSQIIGIDNVACYTGHIEEYIMHHFPYAELKEKYEEMVTFYITEATASCSKIFGVMEKAGVQLNIEDYTVTQGSLEQVFLAFTQDQNSGRKEERSSKKHDL